MQHLAIDLAIQLELLGTKEELHSPVALANSHRQKRVSLQWQKACVKENLLIRQIFLWSQSCTGILIFDYFTAVTD